MLQNPPEMRPIRQVQSQPLLQRHQERESSFGYLALELASVETAGFLANLIWALSCQQAVQEHQVGDSWPLLRLVADVGGTVRYGFAQLDLNQVGRVIQGNKAQWIFTGLAHLLGRIPKAA